MYTTTQMSAAKTAVNDGREPAKFVKRIGSTQFIVTVRFSESEAETLNDKILRLIRNEVQNV